MHMLSLNISLVSRWAGGMDEIIEALCKGTRCETDRLPTLSAANPSQEALQKREQKRPRRVRTHPKHPNTAFETKVAQAASRRLYGRSQLCSQLGMQKAVRNSIFWCIQAKGKLLSPSFHHINFGHFSNLPRDGFFKTIHMNSYDKVSNIIKLIHVQDKHWNVVRILVYSVDVICFHRDFSQRIEDACFGGATESPSQWCQGCKAHPKVLAGKDDKGIST